MHLITKKPVQAWQYPKAEHSIAVCQPACQLAEARSLQLFLVFPICLVFSCLFVLSLSIFDHPAH
eukprot:6191157-Pleurochrysis_carterae.AAC.2